MNLPQRALRAALALPPLLFAIPVLHGIFGTLRTLLMTSHPYFGDAGGVGVDGLAVHLGAALYGDPSHSYDPNAYPPGLSLAVGGLSFIKEWAGWTLLATIIASLALIALAAALAWRPAPGGSWLQRAANAVGALGMGAIAWWVVAYLPFHALYLGRADHVEWALAFAGLATVPAAAAGSRRAAAVSILALTLAIWTKQTAVLAAAAAVTWLVVAALRGRTTPRIAATYGAVLASVNAAVLGILQLASGGWAWYWIVDLPNRDRRVISYGDAAHHMWLGCAVGVILVAILWLPLLPRLLARRDRLPARRLQIATVLALFVALDAVVAPMFRQGAGAVDNHFAGVAWGLGLLAAIAWGLAGFDWRTAVAASGAVLLLFGTTELQPLRRAVTDVNELGVAPTEIHGTVVEVPAPLVELARHRTLYHPVYAELSAERLAQPYPTVYSLEWLPRGGERPGYFLDAILGRHFDVVFLFADDGTQPEWGAGKYEDDFPWKLNETIRAKYDPAPASAAIASGLATRADFRVYLSPGAYQRRPGPDPAPWLARCFGPFRIGSLDWRIGAGGGFWCRTGGHSTALRLVRTRALRSEVRADDVRAGPGARIGVRVRRTGAVEVRLGAWRTEVRPRPGRWVEIPLPKGGQGRLSVVATRGTVADVDLVRATGQRG